jgi:hypothetical protein
LSPFILKYNKKVTISPASSVNHVCCIIVFYLSNYSLGKLFPLCVCEQIIKNDNSYVVDGDVYFSVDSFPEYYSLSGRKPDHNRSRVAVDTRKLNKNDFALWKVNLMHRHQQFTRAHCHFMSLITVSRLLRRVSLPGRALGVMEDQDGILNAAQ